MDTKQAIDILTKEAKDNPVMDAVLHVFALRQRARSTLTVGGLAQKMKEEGFDYSPSQYESVLRILGSVGFGKLLLGPKGRIIALRDIETTLQSIGQATVGNKAEILMTLKKRNKFRQLKLVKPSGTKVPPTIKTAPDKPKVVMVPTGLLVSLNGRPVTIGLPNNCSTEELTALFGKLGAQ